ncbi:uncharacterized protein LOC130047118 [Ostrea edulis]|uniref:uncharacterized protein LOC130047118 n=1 Tax=Ostrea edulis TaxID=37623 RepID=UPI0024AFE2E4|nr:uncharacterized protein LOC130047118 [Ostrea edulis]
MKSCVRSAGMLSEVFKNDIGLLQGEVLSPILFSLYVNDFEIEFLTKGMIPVQIQELNLFVLMYADMVIFSESANDLQSMLDTLFTYTTKWDLSVNVEKTKIVIFRNGSKISSNERWHLNGEPIEIVDKFTYLGVLMNYNGKFSTTQKQLASQGRKAMFSLKSKVSQMYLNTETMLSLFDTYVASILNYSCEVWGSHSAKDVEKVHLEYLKSVLGVRKNTNNGMQGSRCPSHLSHFAIFQEKMQQKFRKCDMDISYFRNRGAILDFSCWHPNRAVLPVQNVDTLPHGNNRDFPSSLFYNMMIFTKGLPCH